MEHNVNAPMPGLVARVVVNVGDTVGQGQEAAVINCMKTEISVTAEQAGAVKTIRVKEWDEIQVGGPMVVLEV